MVALRLVPISGIEMPPWFAGGILFTKVTVPPGSTLAAGGVTFLISIVTAGAAAAVGALTTEKAATPSQPRTAAATPRCAVRRIRPVAIVSLPPCVQGTLLPYWRVTPVTLPQR